MCEKQNLPIIWLCKTLTKKFNKKHYVKVSKEAVFNSNCGMLCDCGHWTFGDDHYHIPIQKDFREVY